MKLPIIYNGTKVKSYRNLKCTSDIGLCVDLTFGLFSFGVLFAGFEDDEAELESDPDDFVLRAVRGFEGDFFRGTPEVPFLLTANHISINILK